MSRGCNIACDNAPSNRRWVLDTATLVVAIRGNLGASNRLVSAGLERRFTWLVSTPLLIEYEAVALRTESYFAERAARADVPQALALLRRAGAGAEPLPGDELPD